MRLPLVAYSEIGTPFQEDSCATFAHDLSCVGCPNGSKYWFMTAAQDWLEVTEYLHAGDGSNKIRTQSLSLQELSQLPFNVYFHLQKEGDLMILPPRRSDSQPSFYSLADNPPLQFFPNHSSGRNCKSLLGAHDVSRARVVFFTTTGSSNSGMVAA